MEDIEWALMLREAGIEWASDCLLKEIERVFACFATETEWEFDFYFALAIEWEFDFYENRFDGVRSISNSLPWRVESELATSHTPY